MAEPALLRISGLTVEFATEAGALRAVDGLDLSMAPGEVVGLVGESGSGKSVTALAIMGLLPAAHITAGSVRFAGTDLLHLDRAALRRLRGAALSMIFQEPMTSLNPVLTIGTQMIETIVAHEKLGLRAARERAVDLLARVGIAAPARRMAEHPHRLSGGMRQRVMIAMALACGPKLLIADEPTTALDVTIQAQILDLLRRLQQEFRMAVLLITHNLGVVAEFADRLTVMYAGRAMEEGPVDAVFARPAHPYTSGLIASIPPLERRLFRLAAIPGTIPSGTALPPGCRFAPRCAHAVEACEREVPALREAGAGRTTSCIRFPAIDPATAFAAPVASAARDTAPAALLSVDGLRKAFPILGGGVLRRATGAIQAVDNVAFELRPGETLALVGESGCGKTTTAQLVLGLLAPDAGRVVFNGKDLASLPAGDLRAARRGMQIVFQDPAGSLDPRMSIGEVIGEPLAIAGWSRARRDARVRELLGRVGLDPSARGRYPHEFSGGQRQRIAIARALAPEPKLIVCDEPVSALDVSIQAQILNLLHDLQQEFRLAYLFISHDLGVVRQVADRVAVMYLGRIVELADAATLFRAPRHPYTQALLAAVPSVGRGRAARRAEVAGDVPDPADRPKGCGFRTRCTRAAAPCAERDPALEPAGSGDQLVACHFREETA